MHAGDLAGGCARAILRSAGQRALPNSSFKGFGRCGTDANGGYAFDTIKPGTVPDPDGKPQAPHLLLAMFARGMLLHLYTRIYFDGEPANAADPVLALVPTDRRATLIARARRATATRSIVSTSACRATTRRCFSTCDRCPDHARRSGPVDVLGCDDPVIHRHPGRSGGGIPGAAFRVHLPVVQIVLLITVGRGLGEVMQRIGQPAVIGQLLAGVLLGPSLFGWLWPAAQTCDLPGRAGAEGA